MVLSSSEELAELQRQAAAQEIQRYYRGARERKKTTEVRRAAEREHMEEQAAIMIQAAFRGHTQRTRYQSAQDYLQEVRAEEAAAKVLQAHLLGYMARKQMEKMRQEQEHETVSVKRAQAAANMQAESDDNETRDVSRLSASHPAQELRKRCQSSQSLALAYVSAIGWGDTTPYNDTARFIAAKWRARRHVLGMSENEVADLMANVTGLVQYKQVFITAFIHGGRILNICAPALAQLGIRQHDHQKIHFSAIREIQKYCMDMEYVPSNQRYPDKVEDTERHQSAFQSAHYSL